MPQLLYVTAVVNTQHTHAHTHTHIPTRAQAELCAARQECTHRAQETEALRGAVVLGDTLVTQLRQQLRELEEVSV